MTNDVQTESSVEQNEVRQLLESRSVVQGWLDKLDAQKGSVSERVLHRVREDYEARLQDVLTALAEHRQVVQDELDRATNRLAAAENDYADAVDELEETRLRHVIGEVDEAAWADRSRILEEATRSADARRESLRADMSRLRELLHQLDERTVDPSTTATPSMPISSPEPPRDRDEEPESDLVEDRHDEAFAEVAESDLVEDRHDEAFAEVAESDAAEADRLAASSDFDDYDPENAAFLQQIDRALTDLPSASVDEEAEQIEDTAPKPGLKCPECGYTNDLSAWFCGVCGADVG